MSTLSVEISRLRRYLRDPSANIWSDGLLLDLWGEVSQDLQKRTRALETCRGLPVPPAWPMSITHDWEWAFTGQSTAYKALREQSGYTVTYVWEVEQYAGLTPSSSEEGYVYTHPWEAFVVSPHEPPVWPLPPDFGEMRSAYHDREPITGARHDDIRRSDGHWKSAQGDPWCYIPDETARTIMLYPRPPPNWALVENEGPVQYVNGDPESTDSGTILYGEGIWTTPEGVAIEFIAEDDTLFLYYRQRPTNPRGWSDEIEWPTYLLRYVRYGVLAKAYLANTDGRIPTLAAFWAARYETGVDAVAKFLRNRTSAVRRSLRTPLQRRRRHARLPSTYPAQ